MTGGCDAAFLRGFYLALIGSKVAIAAVIHADRDRLLRGRGYAIVMQLTALLLLAAGVLLAIDGIRSVA